MLTISLSRYVYHKLNESVFLFRFWPGLHISSLGEGKRREAVGDRDKARDNQAAVMLMKDSHFKYLLTLTTAFLIRILIACHTYYPCSSIGPFFWPLLHASLTLESGKKRFWLASALSPKVVAGGSRWWPPSRPPRGIWGQVQRVRWWPSIYARVSAKVKRFHTCYVKSVH